MKILNLKKVKDSPEKYVFALELDIAGVKVPSHGWKFYREKNRVYPPSTKDGDRFFQLFGKPEKASDGKVYFSIPLQALKEIRRAVRIELGDPETPSLVQLIDFFEWEPGNRRVLKVQYPAFYTTIVDGWLQKYHGERSAMVGLAEGRLWPDSWLKGLAEDVKSGKRTTQEIEEDFDLGVLTEEDMAVFLGFLREVLG